ncbi:metallothionein [Pseudomonas promysalinigenes]|uniref:metallothionein n=1 Tax=Pseudomonas promysalinigenes TaxID=485898 RepID=UPI00391747FF
MNEQRCSCNHCSCTVDANAMVQGDKAYCCEACATGHHQGEPCRMAGCNCSELTQPDENTVDSALDETFPASDPISP